MPAQQQASIFKNIAALTINPEATIWTPASGRKFVLQGGCLAVDVAGTVTLKDNTGGTTILVLPTLTNNGVVTFSLEGDLVSATAGNVLTATGAGAAAKLTGFVYGYEW